MAPGPSKVLPPAGRSTLLSQLQTALSPQSFPASTAAAAAEAACPVVSPEVSAECTAQAQPDLPKGADDALQDRSTSAFTLGANVQANKQVGALANMCPWLFWLIGFTIFLQQTTYQLQPTKAERLQPTVSRCKTQLGY